jgi:colicin import membrane protein
MRAGLVISTTLHAALLGYGLLALSAPRAMEVADVEAFPVDIVPVESITQIQQGDKKAPKAEKSAPVPTRRPDQVADARNVGENSVDNDSPPTPTPKPRDVKAADAPPPAPEPAKKPAVEPEKAEARAEPQPVPATEETPQPQPKQQVKPDPAEQAAVVEDAEAEAVELPDSAPIPQARPQPPKAQTAKAPERKDTEKPAEKVAERPKSEEGKLDLGQVAALLDKQAPSGGGARRSTEQAALGGSKTTTGEKLTQSEMDALRGQLSGCWSIQTGGAETEGLRASVRFNLDVTGKLVGMPQVEASSGNRSFDDSAVRAVQKCDQQGLLVPQGKHEIWAEVLVNFDPSEMF